MRADRRVALTHPRNVTRILRSIHLSEPTSPRIEPEHCDICGREFKPTDRVFRRHAGRKRVVHVECEGTE